MNSVFVFEGKKEKSFQRKKKRRKSSGSVGKDRNGREVRRMAGRRSGVVG